VAILGYNVPVGKHTFQVLIEKDENGVFIASVPSLRGCHTQANDLGTLRKRIREAIELYLEFEGDVEENEFIALEPVEVVTCRS
jgi:predicted RNase H-like HicB family nuclease